MTASEERASDSPSWVSIMLIGRNPRRTLVRVVVLVTVTFVLFKFVLLPIRVYGVSMLPTYHENRVNFVNRLAYRFHEPQRGDVVAIRLAGEHIMYMKRIVALPGETISFHHGRIVVNGKVLYEPYVIYQCDWERPPVTLGLDQFFVVGDNRSMPKEDHEMGEAQRERLVGKVLL